MKSVGEVVYADIFTEDLCTNHLQSCSSHIESCPFSVAKHSARLAGHRPIPWMRFGGLPPCGGRTAGCTVLTPTLFSSL